MVLFALGRFYSLLPATATSSELLQAKQAVKPVPHLQILLAEEPISIGNYGGMKTASEYLWSRRSLLSVCFVVAAILIFQAIRIWVADYRVHSNRIDQMERGVALEPENASAWDRLGRARETDFVNPDPAGAIADFEKAVARVPLSATYWMDLAGAYESIRNIPLAREAFSRARAAYPASAQVAWSYGNFLLRQGDDDAGFAQINHAVQADPSLALPAVSQAWHKTQDANVLLNQVLPATQDAYMVARVESVHHAAVV